MPGATTFVHCCSDSPCCGCAWNNCAPTPLQQMQVQLHGGFSLIVTNQPQGRQHHCQGHYTTKKPWQEFFSSHIGQRGTGTPLADNIVGWRETEDPKLLTHKREKAGKEARWRRSKLGYPITHRKVKPFPKGTFPLHNCQKILLTVLQKRRVPKVPGPTRRHPKLLCPPAVS